MPITETKVTSYVCDNCGTSGEPDDLPEGLSLPVDWIQFRFSIERAVESQQITDDGRRSLTRVSGGHGDHCLACSKTCLNKIIAGAKAKVFKTVSVHPGSDNIVENCTAEEK